MSSSQKFIITLLFSSLTVAATGIGFGRLLAATERAREDRLAWEEEAGEFEKKRKEIRASNFVLEKHERDAERVSRFFVNRERPIAFIEAVEELAGRTRTSMSMDLVGTGADALTFRLTVEGTSSSLSRYLALLENMPYGITFEEFSYQQLPSELLRFSGRDEAPGSRLILLLRVKTL